MTPQEYCQDKAAKSGSSFYYSFLFLPANKRNAITALYAFCREVDDIVDNYTNIDIARIKLNWWRSEIDRLFSEKPAHPVAIALQPAVSEFSLGKDYFLDIIAGMEMDLTKSRYDDFNELSDYCYHVASVVGILSAGIFGYREEKTREYAIALGHALQLTNIIRDVGEDARRNRIYIPQDELEKFSVSETDILNGIETTQFYKLMAFQADRAGKYYKQAMDLLPDSDRSRQLAGVIMANVYLGTLSKIKTSGYRTLKKRISLGKLHKLWIAWTTYRKEKKYTGQLQ
ncbi:MAG: presqualene diphosphate synthase HpnD [Acidiferrobacterales bacterium]